ncbi:hypothetical protein V3390_07605 [Luteimonas sp. FXH3W]|uniref:Uncharacterized protein n=1 Tax=Aquilutibacter rugosus TaxID=3115820 RepID=A0ABU7V1J1_9GAMM
MRLSAPSFPMWFLSVLFGGAGLAARFGYFPQARPFEFWLVAIAFLFLLIGTVFNDL